MTEMDAYNALMLANNQAESVGEILLTVLTGYLLIAFFMGDKLTTFQVCFVNVVFLLAYTSTWASLIEYLSTATYFREILVSLQSDLPMARITPNATPVFNILVAFLLTTGALYFMWAVRHPKPD
jgi:hypothetical protein